MKTYQFAGPDIQFPRIRLIKSGISWNWFEYIICNTIASTPAAASTSPFFTFTLAPFQS